MKFYDLCTKKVYTKKDGTENTTWLKCGSMRESEEGKKFIELNQSPDVTIYVFDQKPKEEKSGWA